jgi:hypothetical protein
MWTSLEYGVACGDGVSHVGAKGTAPILARQGRTHGMEAETMLIRKPRPLSSATILGRVGPVDETSTSTSLLPPHVSPKVGVSRFANQSPPHIHYQRKTPWISFFGVRPGFAYIAGALYGY